MQELREKLAQTENERDQYLTLARQERAELENYRKRVDRDRANYKRESLAGFLKSFFNPLDDLDRSIASGEKQGATPELLQGLNLVRENLWKSLREAGVATIEAVNQPFDPAFHEALTMLPGTGRPAHTVVEVFQPGYQLDGFVLRPAKVIVAAPDPSAPAQPAGETQPEESEAETCD